MPKPVLLDDHVPQLLKELYGLTVSKVVRLDGYDDLNLFLQVEPVSLNPHLIRPSQNGYLLKISNGKYTLDHDCITAQNVLMLFLHENLKNVQIPLPVQSRFGNFLEFVTLPWKAGNTCVAEEHPKGNQFIARLLTFIPGKMLSDVAMEPGKDILQQIGGMLGRFVKVMKGFDEPNLWKAPTDIWALENVDHLIPRLKAVEDVDQLAVFREVISDFASHLLLHRDKLEQGILHGDINEGNIIVEQIEEENLHLTLKGIIDFSDTHRSCRIFDLVLAITYMMLEAEKKKTMNPIDAGAYVLFGYLQETAITAAELSILKIGIEARITQSLVLGQYTFKFDQPGNLYVLGTQKTGWKILQMLRQISNEELFAKWKLANPSLRLTDISSD